MRDSCGRQITYMRLSLTDRCNLRCRYCMPHGIALDTHAQMLTLEELLRVSAIAVSLGITKFKITGGEPLVRRGCVDFAARLKHLQGVEQVTLTTNGLLLPAHLDGLAAAGIDAINISIDTLNDQAYSAWTGAPRGSAAAVLQAIEQCAAHKIPTKVNAVLLDDTFDGILALAELAARLPVDVRFIELMPIGEGGTVQGVPMQHARDVLHRKWPDLHPTDERRGNGPAQYEASGALQGRIGFIGAMSGNFCAACNRVRLTAAGHLKPCLCYEEGMPLRSVLRAGCSDAELREAMQTCILAKPRAHSFQRPADITEHSTMNEIGG